MARAFLAKELHVEAQNETGLLGRICSALSLEGVFITHLSAYSVGKKGYLQMIVRDTEKAKKALHYFVSKIEERDALIVEFENKVGTLAPVTKLLGNHGIFIDYVYGTSGDGFKIVGVFSTSDNQKAADLINGESGALGVDTSG
ncbi:MAG: hypothetical protein NC930_02690 [Candidatus Omnitrophica bacterium]|nr:hypothetical protein [Candidatus Omnitrophota bacterium]